MKKLSLLLIITGIILLVSCNDNTVTDALDDSIKLYTAAPEPLITAAEPETTTEAITTEPETTIPQPVIISKTPDELPDELKEKVEIEYDHIDEFTIIKAKKPALSSIYAFIYTGDNKEYTLFLSMMVTDKKVLKTERIKLKSGENVLEFEIDPDDLDKDSFTNQFGRYYVERTFEGIASSGAVVNKVPTLRSVIGSETTYIRFSGSGGTHDNELEDDEKQAISTVIECYEYLIGNTK